MTDTKYSATVWRSESGDWWYVKEGRLVQVHESWYPVLDAAYQDAVRSE